ncbi:hypothetical protein QQ045_001909 [Rhodiola kirilowii]
MESQNNATIGNWLDGRHVLIILQCEEDVTRVLSSPWRKIDHSLFRLFRWTPDFSTRKENTRITAWVRLPNLPPELFNAGYIKQVVSSFAKFLDLDERTKTYSVPSMARVCVEVDVTKEIPTEVWLQLTESRGVWQSVVVESKLAYCVKCRLHGHELSSCRKRRENRTGDEVKAMTIVPKKDDVSQPSENS